MFENDAQMIPIGLKFETFWFPPIRIICASFARHLRVIFEHDYAPFHCASFALDVNDATLVATLYIAQDKRDKTVQTGSGKTTLTQLDHFVLDFIGRDSPGIQGLNVPDSGAGAAAEQSFNNQQLNIIADDDGDGLLLIERFILTFHARLQISMYPTNQDRHRQCRSMTVTVEGTIRHVSYRHRT